MIKSLKINELHKNRNNNFMKYFESNIKCERLVKLIIHNYRKEYYNKKNKLIKMKNICFIIPFILDILNNSDKIKENNLYEFINYPLNTINKFLILKKQIKNNN